MQRFCYHGGHAENRNGFARISYLLEDTNVVIGCFGTRKVGQSVVTNYHTAVINERSSHLRRDRYACDLD